MTYKCLMQNFDDRLVLFKQQDGNFSETKKKLISQQTHNGSYIYDVHMKGRWLGAGLKICHMSADSLDFKQKIYCSFLRMWRSQKWSFFVTVINVWPLNGLKLQPIQSLEAVVSSSTSSHKPHTFWLWREQPPPLSPPQSPVSLLCWWQPNRSRCYFQLALNFIC